MSKEENSDVHLDKSTIDCNFCKCNRKALHKETKTSTDKEGNVVVSKIENRTSWKVGRGTTPDGNTIFQSNMNDHEDVDTADTGFGSRKPTPEERLQKLEEDVKELQNLHKLNNMD